MEIAFFAVIIILLAIIAWRLFQGREPEKQEDQSLILIQNQITELNRTLEAKLGESAKAITSSTDKAFAQATESAKLIKDITQELAKVGEGQRQVANIADNLKSLQDILKNPKQRGARGEAFLGMELKNILPPGQYETQHYFKDGTAVDAVIVTKDGLIPVDSKFSLENYERIYSANNEADRTSYENAFYDDLKRRIDETSKYIKPEEGTLDFAFMFIPSEVIYYDLLNRKIGVRGDVNLMEYAFVKKKVVIVSPTTLLAYLQTVLQGLRALRIEESAKKIGERVGELGKHLSNYQEYMQKIGKNLSTTVSAYNAAGKEFVKINKDIYRVTGDELGLETPLLDKPEETSGAD
jgi:DNA recombination protein RmuC